MTSRNKGLSSTDQGRQIRETLGTRLRDGMIDEVITLVTSFLVTSNYVFYEKNTRCINRESFQFFSATFVFTSWKPKVKSPLNSLFGEIKSIDIFNLRDLTQVHKTSRNLGKKSKNARKRFHWHCNI